MLGANVLPMELLVVFGALAMMLLVEVFNRKSIYGRPSSPRPMTATPPA